MLIDWFTVAAQMINFLILVLLLKRFLYGPLLRTMEERQQGINARLAEIETNRLAADETRARLASEATTFDRTRVERLCLIDQECEERRRQVTEELRLEIDTLRNRWQKALAQEQDTFRRTLSELAQRELIELAGKITLDLADARLEEQLTGRFLQRLEDALAAPTAGGAFASLREKADFTAVVRSSFSLAAPASKRIETLLRMHLPTAHRLEFQVSPEIGCGIELQLDHHKLAWSIDEYVASFQSTIDEAIRAKSHATL